MLRHLLFFLTLTCSCYMAHATFPAVDWQPATWHNEKVLVSISLDWKAVVSLERGRLIYFGPASREFNLLLAPPNRDNPSIWGGHRVWLGPQSAWSIIWPPPHEWESSGPEAYASNEGVLRLLMTDTKDGWPRVTRTYQWQEKKLACGVELKGGTRAAQIIQIFQVPAATIITVQAQPGANIPSGYVRLPSMVSHFKTDFPQPKHVTRSGNELTLRHIGVIEKLGFFPQALTGQTSGYILTVAKGTLGGKVVDEPDQGMFTQVYLGGDEPFIELEQLSPLFAAGETAAFTVILEGKAR